VHFTNRQSSACLNVTVIDEDDASGDCRAVTNYIPVGGGGNDAHISNEDLSNILRILLNSSRALLSDSASGHTVPSFSPRDRLESADSSSASIAQLKDIVSGYGGFAFKWSTPERAIRTLVRLHVCGLRIVLSCSIDSSKFPGMIE
jgi:hypothetical protein